MSRLFVGTMMLALATSLPELVTDITAARAGAPDLAVGDLFGSSMANMAILAIIDLLYRGKVWPSVELGHARVAAVAIALTAMAALSIFAQGHAPDWVGRPRPDSHRGDLRALHCLVSSHAAFGAARTRVSSNPVTETHWMERTGRADVARWPLGPLWHVGSTDLAHRAHCHAQRQSHRRLDGHRADLSRRCTLGRDHLPTRARRLDRVGSNRRLRHGGRQSLWEQRRQHERPLVRGHRLHRRGPILAAVSQGQIVAALGAILLMSVAVAAIVGESERTRIRRLEPDAIVLLILYAATLVAVAYYG